MAITKNDANKVSARVYSRLSLILTVVLLVMGVAGVKAGGSITDVINKSLVTEKLSFPAKGDPTFSPEMFPEAQAYAGQQVKDGATAKAYADKYLAVQLKMIGQGKTSSEVSAAAAANPTDPALQQAQGIMFQISTGQALLISAYGSATQAMAISYMGYAALAGAAALAVVAVIEAARSKIS